MFFRALFVLGLLGLVLGVYDPTVDTAQTSSTDGTYLVRRNFIYISYVLYLYIIPVSINLQKS